jgi:hypothetical protein
MTKYELAEYPSKIRYSLTEHRMFDIIPKNGHPVGTADIAKSRGPDWDVKDPLKHVAVTMMRLIKKVDANREPFKICKNDRKPGNNRIDYWIEARGKKVNGR